MREMGGGNAIVGAGSAARSCPSCAARVNAIVVGSEVRMRRRRSGMGSRGTSHRSLPAFAAAGPLAKLLSRTSPDASLRLSRRPARRFRQNPTATLPPQRDAPAPPSSTPSPSPTPTEQQPLPTSPELAVPSKSGAPLASLLVLNGVTLIWGTQHAVMKGALSSGASPSTLSLLRFALAASVALAPVVLRGKTLASMRAAAPAGLQLGAWMFAGYAAQAVGLEYTTAARSGFLVYLNVKLVPVFAKLVYGRQVSAATWGSAALALAGTALLTYDGSPPNIGDAWSVAAAAASAMYILRMEGAADEAGGDAAALNAVTLVTVAVLCAGWYVVGGGGGGMDGITGTTIGAVVYLGVIATTLSNWLQAVGQKGVKAEVAAVIFAMDPVFGALVSYVALGERFGAQGWVGMGLIATAAAFSSFTAGREGKEA